MSPLAPARPAERAELRAIFDAAVAAVEGSRAVTRHVELDGSGRLVIAGRALPEGAPLVVVGAGKAAAAMARGLEAVAGDRITSGVVVTKDGHGLELSRCRVLEASHPVPDARCEAAAKAVLAEVESAPADAVIVVLLSGGASALLACPSEGMTSEDLAATTDLLLASGADICALNTVRKHLSRVSGGRLAEAAAPRRVECLALSDVRGDPPDVIASGPCVPDPTTFADAASVVSKLALEPRLPARVAEALRQGLRGERPETPKPGQPAFEGVHFTCVASLADAIGAACAAARERGLEPVVVTRALCGEASRAGARLAALIAALRTDRIARCLVAGGETTVTLAGGGRGGRSQELALAAALAFPEGSDACLLAAGTDGTDGPTDAAGAFVDADSVARGEAGGVRAADLLARNDSYAFFEVEGGHLHTGPTSTNVTDLVLIRVP